MQRKLIHDLCRWKANSSRKPLVLEGARQVGKTYLLQQFGRERYKHTVYVNFDRLDPDIAELFAGAIHPARIIDFLAVKYSTAIANPPNTSQIILPSKFIVFPCFNYNYKDSIFSCGSKSGTVASRGVRIR